MSICQFTEIVLGFLARVVRANPVREQVTIVMSEKKFLPISMSTLQSTADFTRKTKIQRVSLFSAIKNKDLVAFTRVQSLAWLADVVASLHVFNVICCFCMF